MKVLVTGGAGFIGSNLVDTLMQDDHDVRVFDNLTSGDIHNLDRWDNNPRFDFMEGDLLNQEQVKKAVRDCEVVFHLAANPEVNIKKASPADHFNQNIMATFFLLEAIRNSDVSKLAFTSSSTVYGEASLIPTPENYGPLVPISLYGASKLACESLIMAYSSTYDFSSKIYRLANVVGPKSNHGVIYDFVYKLKRNPEKLEILGDGTQSKSYLYVSDCIEGMLIGNETKERNSIFNLSSTEQTNVLEIANIVKEETSNPDAELYLTGGVDGGRGWKGDVKTMQLDIGKILSNGWVPKYTSSEAVRKTARNLVQSGACVS